MIINFVRKRQIGAMFDLVEIDRCSCSSIVALTQSIILITERIYHSTIVY